MPAQKTASTIVIMCHQLYKTDKRYLRQTQCRQNFCPYRLTTLGSSDDSDRNESGGRNALYRLNNAYENRFFPSTEHDCVNYQAVDTGYCYYHHYYGENTCQMSIKY